MNAHRTTLLLDKAIYERYRLRARQRGTTVSAELRKVLDRDVEEANGNQGWLSLATQIQEDLKTHPAPPGGSWPPIDSDEAQDQMARDLFRDAMNREPDW